MMWPEQGEIAMHGIRPLGHIGHVVVVLDSSPRWNFQIETARILVQVIERRILLPHLIITPYNQSPDYCQIGLSTGSSSNQTTGMNELFHCWSGGLVTPSYKQTLNPAVTPRLFVWLSAHFPEHTGEQEVFGSFPFLICLISWKVNECIFSTRVAPFNIICLVWLFPFLTTKNLNIVP